MRITILFLTVVFMHSYAAGVGQKLTLSGKDFTLKEIFATIKKQTGYSVFANEQLLSNTKSVSISVQNVSLTDFLDIVLRNQPLDYVIQGTTVVLSRKSAEVAIPVEFSITPITGRIIDSAGAPLAGATLSVKGKNGSVRSGENGSFQLNLSVGDVLVVSYVGYETKTVTVTAAMLSSNSLVIALKRVVASLDDIVMVGYGSSRRKDLTGSIASVDVNEVRNAPYVSIDQALAGKASGVQVTQSDGAPGGVARIRIRGGASLIGGNDPLYIIDGVQVTIQNKYLQAAADIVNPTERLGKDGQYMNSTVGGSFARGVNTLAGLNINDIETIDILKDASATAIYGSRAANGVVIITTKKGKKNEKPILEANYYTGMSKAITEKLLTADQYKAVMLEGAKNVNALRAQQGAQPVATATSIINDINFLGTGNTDWMSVITRTGITQNADLSVRGGGSGSRYYSSLAYNSQTGALLGTDMKRISGKISLDNEITSRLRVITNLDFGFTKNRITNGIYASALYAPPTLDPYNADGTPKVFDPVSFGSSPASGIQNPVALLEGINKARNTMLLGALSVEYDVLKTLKFRTTGSINYSSYHQLNYVPSSAYMATASGASLTSGGVGTQAQTAQTDLFFENTLTWDKQFNADNRINLLVGTSWQQSNSEMFSASGQGFPDDHFLNGLASAAIYLQPLASETQNSLLSFYLRANYAFKERYLLTLTGRSDASSKFPRNNRVAYFPSFGVAWRASEERFLKSASWLNELKFRASLGYTGTQNLGDNLFYTLYTPASYGGTNALLPTQLGNDRIKWENTLQKDGGIDFAILNSRIRGAIGYYTKQTTRLLMARDVAPSSGFASALVNIADIHNGGWELELRGDIIRSKNLNWNMAANLSANRSKVTNINRDVQDPKSVGYADPFYNSEFSVGNTVLREGEPVGLIYGYIYKGIIKTPEQLDDYKANSLYAGYGLLTNLGLGYPMYGLIDTGVYKGYFARDIIGRAEPKFYGGITNTLSYKQFSMIALLSFSYGGDLLYMQDIKSMGLGDRGNRNTRILEDHYSATNTNVDRPALLLTETNNYGTGVSSFAVHDGSYIKLKSITVNYELSPAVLSKIGFRTAMVYVSGTNLFCITGYPGPDPEISNDPYSLISGYTDAGTYPTIRQYSFGVRLGF